MFRKKMREKFYKNINKNFESIIAFSLSHLIWNVIIIVFYYYTHDAFLLDENVLIQR